MSDNSAGSKTAVSGDQVRAVPVKGGGSGCDEVQSDNGCEPRRDLSAAESQPRMQDANFKDGNAGVQGLTATVSSSQENSVLLVKRTRPIQLSTRLPCDKPHVRDGMPARFCSTTSSSGEVKAGPVLPVGGGHPSAPQECSKHVL